MQASMFINIFFTIQFQMGFLKLDFLNHYSLITGQEQREVPFSTHRSSTVEMADLNQDYDVVVIDEIQMICDAFRGYAWTRALMGVRCKEIHVAGGLEAREIVKKICRMCGDDFELKTYKRFSKLRVQENSLSSSSAAKVGERVRRHWLLSSVIHLRYTYSLREAIKMSSPEIALWLSQDLTYLLSKERLRKRLHLNALLFMAHFHQVRFQKS